MNGCQVRKNEFTIQENDFFAMYGCNFYYSDGWFYFSDQLPIDTTFLTEIVSAVKNHLEYPKLIRSVRQKYHIPEEKLEALPPKGLPAEPRKNLVMTIIPLLATLMLSVVMRYLMGRSAIFMIYCAGAMVISGIMSIWNYRYQGKKYKEDCKRRTEKYTLYMQEMEEKIIHSRQKERSISRQQNTSLQEQLEIIQDFDSRLFEKDPDDEDFLACYLGTGAKESANPVIFRRQEYKDVDDPLMDYPELLSEKYVTIEDMPILLELKDRNTLGFIGERGELYQIAKNVIVSTVALHYYKDVKLCLLIDEQDCQYFAWTRWLQNIQSDNNGLRMIGYDQQSKSLLLESLYEILSARDSGSQIGSEETQYVVFVYRSEGINKHPVSKFFDRAKQLGFTFLFFEEYPEFLNKECEIRIFLGRNGTSGYIQEAENGEKLQCFEYPHITTEQAASAAMRLSCVYVEDVNLEASLTSSISLYELLHIDNARQLMLEQRWNNSKIYESMAAPLGVKGGDEVVYLDLHEKGHGPHGLVAGTTGAGKSEILQSYILSMATLFHPYDVGFIIIDFKTSYAQSSLNSLKNTDNFTDSAIEHIFEGQVNGRGKAVGYHYEGIEDTAGKIISGTELPANEYGVYKAQVEVNGILKTTNDGFSTFYSKNMSPQEVVDAINESYGNRVFIRGNTFVGETSSGLKIEMFLDKTDKIISVYPKY